MLRIDATPVARMLGAALVASALAGCAEDCERLGIFGPSRVSAAHAHTAYAQAAAAPGEAADRTARASSAQRAKASAAPTARAALAPSASSEPAGNAMPPVQALE